MTFTRKVLATFLLGSAFSASAEGFHYRFWRGDRISGMTAETFRDGLREVFVPATLKQGVGKGLLAYQPVLLAKDHSPKLPDEVALVTYASEEEYKRLRATPEGKAYGELHWDYFTRETSRSLVPEAFRGKAEAGKAYDLLLGKPDWSRGTSVFSVRLRREEVSEEKFLAALAESLARIQRTPPSGLRAHLALVTGDYVMEFSLWGDGQSPRALPGRGKPFAKVAQKAIEIRPRDWNGHLDFQDGVRLSERSPVTR